MLSFSRFFASPQVEELDVDAEVLNQANELLDFSSTTYFTKFMDYLDREASKPLKVGDHMDMIQSAVRSNTLREIRTTMLRRVSNARSAALGVENS